MKKIIVSCLLLAGFFYPTIISAENDPSVMASNCWDIDGKVSFLSSGIGQNPLIAEAKIDIGHPSKIESLVIGILYSGRINDFKDWEVTIDDGSQTITVDPSMYDVEVIPEDRVSFTFKTEEIFANLNLEDLLSFSIKLSMNRFGPGAINLSGNVLVNDGGCPLYLQEVVAQEPTLSDVPCDTVPEVILPETEGIEYVVTDIENGYLVEAVALDGYEITNPQTWTLLYQIEACKIPEIPGEENNTDEKKPEIPEKEITNPEESKETKEKETGVKEETKAKLPQTGVDSLNYVGLGLMLGGVVLNVWRKKRS